MDSEESLIACIRSANAFKVRKCLDYEDFTTSSFDHALPLHEIIATCKDFPEKSCSRSEIIFMLCNAGFDVNNVDQVGFSPLFHAVQYKDEISCRALLQCGADMHAQLSPNQSSIFEKVMESSSLTIKQAFQDFKPGLWEAVKTCDINATRRLVNLWCRTDLVKNDKNLKDLALDSGVEGIIGLILNVEPSMRLAHHLLAGDSKNAHKLLDTIPQHINFNFRNLNESGAPLLYYAIKKHMADVIHKMRLHDVKLYSVMADEHHNDMPVFFCCLKSDMTEEIIDSLLQGKDVENVLARILYKGKTVLQVAIDNNLCPQAFNVLIQHGGPAVIASRNQFDETPRTYALNLGKDEYALVIDKNVDLWVTSPEEYPGKRQLLALYGYDEFQLASSESNFSKSLSTYQSQIIKLCEASEKGDIDLFRDLMYYSGPDSSLFCTELFWRGRAPGQGLPILHRAVLWERRKIIELIFKSKPKSESIDNLLDQYHRTAVHYAFGIRGGGSVVSMLVDQGCSEHTLDKNGKEPLDFKLQRNARQMTDLIMRLKEKDFKSAEPEPWEEKCELDARPVSKLFHHSHSHSHNHPLHEAKQPQVQQTRSCLLL